MKEKIFIMFPEGQVKNLIRWTYYKIFYKRKVYSFKFDNETTLKAYTDLSQSDDYKTIKGYFKYYSLKESDVVIDCGAHVGVITLYASQKVGASGKVIAFEPDDMNYLKLKDNIKLNNLKNVILIKKGVWSKDATLEFFSTLAADSSFVIKGTNKSVKVPVTAIDSELKKHKINRLDFIKMDIEGAEIEAVKGCTKFMKKCNVHFAIASYHIVDGKKTCFELEKWFKKHNYNAKTGYKAHLTTYGWKK
jgi:FkbM family methyltransferase